MSPETAMAASHRATQLENVLRKVIRGKDDIIRLALVSDSETTAEALHRLVQILD